MRGRALVLGLLALVSAQCGGAGTTTLPPEGQVLLYVTTDAPLPPPPGQELGPSDVPPLFDTVQFDVFPPGEARACPTCSRRFPIDRDLVDHGHASIGIATPFGTAGYRARVRIFRAVAQRDGEPVDAAALGAIVLLPPLSAEGKVELTVDLKTDSVGTIDGSLDAPAVASRGRPSPRHVGTWPSAQRRPCSGPAGADDVCVPGGAFWMGNPSVVAVLGSVDANVPRLTVMSPFFLDKGEVTVAPFRSAGVAIPNDSVTANPGDPRDTEGSKGSCTFSSVPVGQPDVVANLPVNCISWLTSRAYCLKMGKDLPTEAQFEYAASGLRSATYIWGEDAPACADATYARLATTRVPQACVPLLSSPAEPGGGRLDRLALDGIITDLAGNLREWTRDVFAPQTHACWSSSLVSDPLCDAPGELRSVRGGSFRDQAAFLRAATRHYGYRNGDPSTKDPDNPTGRLSPYVDESGATQNGQAIGFRCARGD